MDSQPGSGDSIASSPSVIHDILQGKVDSLFAGSKHDTVPSANGDVAREERALESHEIIELQGFIDRKAWIESKIKHLEKMPPIEVFIGLDALRISAEEIPGLPTKAELKQWIIEHDEIEKNTEIFDAGELMKLRKFTKAAAQRHMSPADTDLIELTLTTIYELDKLLHLLRDRTENLDLLGIRLTWEEHRSTGWKERRNLTSDLEDFLTERARWNPSVYSSVDLDAQSPPPMRRGSVASVASAASELSSSSSSALSRTARYRLAELLSRDAAQFAGRVSALRHGKIDAAGKSLDRLIDHSRKPVPDELLDEQDRLEEKCINDLETLGYFAMNVATQWRKADEFYAETLKDFSAAQMLLEEIEVARLHHPTARQSTAFISRSDAIVKRLVLRGSPSTSIPQPSHPLYPDQQSSNKSVLLSLSSEMASATQLAQKTSVAAKEYKAGYESVKRVEDLLQSSEDLCSSYEDIHNRLQSGIHAGEGDGSPPDLTSIDCLENTKHSAFLAFLPSIFAELDSLNSKTNVLLRTSTGILLDANRPGVDFKFKLESSKKIACLSTARSRALAIQDEITAQVNRLQQARKLLNHISSHLQEVDRVGKQLTEEAEELRWQQQGSRCLTMVLSSQIHGTDAGLLPKLKETLTTLEFSLPNNATKPLAELQPSLEQPLYHFLSEKLETLKVEVDKIREAMQVVESLKEQSSAMQSISADFNRHLSQVQAMQSQAHSDFERVLFATVVDELPAVEAALQLGYQSSHQDAQSFIDSLVHRGPFISSPSSLANHHYVNGNGNTPEITKRNSLPFPSIARSANEAVRADCNYFAMTLGGELQNLERQMNHFHLGVMAAEMDRNLVSLAKDLDIGFCTIKNHEERFVSAGSHVGQSESLRATAGELSTYKEGINATISEPLLAAQELMQRINSAPNSHDVEVEELVCISRGRTLHEAQERLVSWNQRINSLIGDVNAAEKAELARIEEEDRLVAEELARKEEQRLAAEKEARRKAEEERIAAEEEARRKAEEERLAFEAEARRKADEERLAAEEEARRKAEEQRLAVEAEAQRKAKEERLAAEEEARRKAEEERLAVEAEAQWKAKEERLAVEEEARRKAEEVRLAVEAKARRKAEEERLAVEEEARRKAEEERLAVEAEAQRKAEEERLAAEEETRRKAEEDRVAAEEQARRRAEKERLAEEADARRKAEEERLAAEADARKKEEADRLFAEEAQHQAEREARQRAEEEANRLETERLAAEAAAREKIEKERLTELAAARTKAEETRAALEEATRKSAEEECTPSRPSRRAFDDSRPLDPPFALRVAHSNSPARTPQSVQLQKKIHSLRRRLRSLNINEVARPPASSLPSAQLPTRGLSDRMLSEFAAISDEASRLANINEEPTIVIELESLHAELTASKGLLDRVQQLASLSQNVQKCDEALSDLLEHIDSHPNQPSVLSSSFVTLEDNASPEDQLRSRLTQTRALISQLSDLFEKVSDDHRAREENTRIMQTWQELKDMADDKIIGRRSRPSSSMSSGQISSGRSSHISSVHSEFGQIAASKPTKKTAGYANLSASGRGKFLTPSTSGSRRAVSNSSESRSYSPSPSLASAPRSISGPFGLLFGTNRKRPPSSLSISSRSTSASSSSLYGTTFASRQRSASSSTSVSSPQKQSSTPRQSISSNNFVVPTTPSRSRQRSSTSSTFGRAPRLSTSSIPSTPKRSLPPKKAYVANPKNKLDVAVGDVVNKLPVNINIEVVADTWKDQSGKYWIGDQDPKLCFCRILRSRTVMVRVGGGWCELSKFIQGHFADLFRLLPESPPRMGTQDEKWISSATLLEQSERREQPPHPPRTPEPKAGTPTFQFTSPDDSPHSIRSSSSKGSPLTPLQFMRRANADAPPVLPGLRPVTPSNSTSFHSRLSNIPSTPSRNSWRP